ncbi:MAG: hypothetical protein A2161_03610 [Candidatus Schekmanbacteria bacterium RBG_13_48_7]|uniref:Sigma-54-dependent Fis family transcriptional regulator n=1 Tax=Candidatus Schekmanbacteria bacterium RBG_13_48_7 TaxID=1817878 RepID=A0A1F7RMQ7_9BACT|nr:MAG: hypothetical protein A2161_03610 [Candidatus Schekmanbacteria bacterium RBG_13_48_7]
MEEIESKIRRVLVVDDDLKILASIKDFLSAQNFIVETAENGFNALEKLQQSTFDCLITDVNMPRMDGLEFMEKAFHAGYDLPVIILTGFGSVNDAVEAIRKGATDYLSKPINGSELTNKVTKAILEHQKSKIVRNLIDWMDKQGGYDRLFGTSPALHELLFQASKFFGSDESVLIVGEKGSGKQNLAKLLSHYGSLPIDFFIEIDPADYQLDELKKLLTTRYAKPESNPPASQRTILITEISDLPVSILNNTAWNQSARKFYPRILGLTSSEDFEKQIHGKENKLLQFLRKNLLIVPQLCYRKEDIPLLASRLLKKLRGNDEIPLKLAPDAMHAMMLYEWPGNLTELESKIEGAAVMAIGPQIFKNHVFGQDDMETGEVIPYREAKESFEKSYLTNLLKKCKGNMSLAATISKKDRKNLYQKILKYNINVDKFRS